MGRGMTVFEGREIQECHKLPKFGDNRYIYTEWELRDVVQAPPECYAVFIEGEELMGMRSHFLGKWRTRDILMQRLPGNEEHGVPPTERPLLATYWELDFGPIVLESSGNLARAADSPNYKGMRIGMAGLRCHGLWDSDVRPSTAAIATAAIAPWLRHRNGEGHE